jgi:alternate signal-mediated exported protein
MKRLTKAAIATGAAAVLLLVGAPTLAYWTASGTLTGAATLTSGDLTATNGTCGAWVYDGTTNAVTAIVPGDKVTTTCTATIKGTGDHLAVTVSIGSETWTAPTDPLPSVLGITSGTMTVTDASNATVAPGSDGSYPLASGATYTVSVPISATFPYGTTADNSTQDQTAQLAAVTVTFTQAQTTANPAP